MGKLRFTVSPLSIATAATQAKYESLAGWCRILRLRAGDIRAVPNFGTTRFDRVSKDGLTVSIYREGTGYSPTCFDVNQGGLSLGPFNLSDLPADDTDVAWYMRRHGTGLEMAIGAVGGTVIHSGTMSVGSSFGSGAGTGALTFGAEAGDSDYTIDAYAVLAVAGRSGDARFAMPLDADADVIGGYYMSEESGTTTADFKAGGTALTLTDTTWVTDDGWESGGGAGPGNFSQYLRDQLQHAGLL